MILLAWLYTIEILLIISLIVPYLESIIDVEREDKP